MTTEYSFLRTSVPRGPKLGSLGIPAPKERKSKSSRSGKIHSLADYKTPDTGGDKPSPSRNHAVSAEMNSSSASTLSEISSVSVSTLSEISTSSASTLSEPSVLSLETPDGNNRAVELTSAASRATAGREEEEAVVGRYPSLREVLQAANEELELEKEGGANEELEMEGGVESRSRRDSFSST